MKRLDPSLGSSALTIGFIAVIGLLLSIVAVVPSGSQVAATGGPGAEIPEEAALLEGATDAGPAAGNDPVQGTASSPAGQVPGQSQAQGGGTAVNTAPGVSCAPGKNGGTTDVGVTKDRIKLAATVVDDGPGASFLSPVRIGMQAVVNKANRAGGICGRQLSLTLRNDSWVADTGRTFIQNFVESDKVFALAVVPSSEGLLAADNYIRSKGVPVVGTDGMLIHQYLNPWIWPVATPTVSTMHIMAKEAYDRGARRFAIVFDAKYHFGVEGALAYNQAVKRLTGQDIEGFDPSLKKCLELFCGIQPGRPSYTTEAQGFVQLCYNTQGKHCDFVAYLLEPDTARSFMSAEPRSANPLYGMGGAQPLFNRTFAEACRDLCSTMQVWTGYLPPIEAFAARPEVAKYVDDVRAESATADVVNQFLEGGYIGMTLLVKALQQVGPTLTRDNLRKVLDSMEFDSGMAGKMRWQPGNHFANTSAHAFLIVPGGWRSRTPLLADPWVSEHQKNG